jgi:hypothetical protein
VFLPSVPSRMKKALDMARQRIDPAQIWALVKVASVACECEIVGVVGAAVLTGDYMLDVV